MSKQLELMVQERAVSGKDVKLLRRKGIVPANMYGHSQSSVSLQVSNVALQKVLARSGQNVILLLKVENRPPVQALIKKVQRKPMTGETIHVDFHVVAATEKLTNHVQFHFVNEVGPAILGDLTVFRPLSEVMVECLPADLPSNIEVDLSGLTEAGAVVRVGDLKVAPGVTILTDHNELVAGVRQKARSDKTDAAEGKTETAAPAPATKPQR